MNNLNYLAQEVSARVSASWPWYLTRASGIVASIVLVLLMITGITMFTGHHFKFMDPLKSWANHRTLGIIFAISVAVHILSLLFDKFISFNLFQVLIPFVSDYKPFKVAGMSTGSLGVALGIFSLYIGGSIIFTSLTAIRSERPALWKTTHLLSYILMVFIFFHSIMIGTDLMHGFWRAIWVMINIVVLGFFGLRLTRTGSLSD